MNKIKAFFAGIGALMIAYLVVAILLFFFTILVVIFTGANPNGGFDMLLAISKIPLSAAIPCVIISLYSVSYFCKSRKKINNFLNSLY